jgi:hypothetical protein
MYTVSHANGVYHIALNENQTLCRAVLILNAPDKRRRFDDWRLASETPTDRVCVLCSRCAELSGDERDFTRRIIYPPRQLQPIADSAHEEKTS